MNSLIFFAGVLTPDGLLRSQPGGPGCRRGLRAEEVLGRPFEKSPLVYSAQIQAQLRDAIRRARPEEKRSATTLRSESRRAIHHHRLRTCADV
ncbi:MAG: hypothetical protein MPW13_15125 [Candidatus Manganitrophus sp.]|nr:hypothetical protein [Candidatus Manganitrophus sp.]